VNHRHRLFIFGERKNQIKTRQSLDKAKNKLAQRVEKKVAEANPLKLSRQKQTRKKVAQGKGHQKTQCLTMEPKEKNCFFKLSIV